MGENNTCFVIAPIGSTNSDIRKRSDKVLRHVIQPVAEQLGFEAIRADRISEPGIITSQMIQHIIGDPMVVADLTGWNPNVFYELAIRHALRKPYIQIIRRGEHLPFDVSSVRTIEVDITDLDDVEAAKKEICRQMRSMMKNEIEIDSPISVAIDLEVLRLSGNPEKRQIADVLSSINELRQEMQKLGNRLTDPKSLMPPSYIKEVLLKEVGLFEDSITPMKNKYIINNKISKTLDQLKSHLLTVDNPSKLDFDWLKKAQNLISELDIDIKNYMTSLDFYSQCNILDFFVKDDATE